MLIHAWRCATKWTSAEPDSCPEIPLPQRGLPATKAGRAGARRGGHPEERLEAALQLGEGCEVSLHLKHFQKVSAPVLSSPVGSLPP